MNSSQPIAVLEIIGNAIVGGMEVCVSRLVERLPPDRFTVVCLCPFESKFTQTLRDAGATVYITPMQDHPQWESLQLAATLVRMHKIQIIHAHLPNAHLLAGLVSALTGVPAFATVHGRGIAPLDFEISRLTSTHLSVVCETARVHALALGIPESRVHLIPNGVDADFYAARDDAGGLNTLLEIPRTTPIVGFVGRLAPEKGPDIFIRMASFVHAEMRDARFVLVGDGPLRPSLERLATQLGLYEHVKFAGLQRNMRSIYQSLALFVSASHSEGMPLALMEAMASGCPCVATQVGGVAEVMQEGTTGLLARPNDPEHLGAAVISLLKDAPRRSAMGVSAQQRIAASFVLKKSVEQTGALIKRLAKSAVGAASLSAARDHLPVARIGNATHAAD